MTRVTAPESTGGDGEGSGGGHGKAIVAALAANLGIAVSKFVAFAFTGSSSMLAEGVHSTADSANQVLLLVGGRRAEKPATASHPFGYGRYRYLYAFLVAIVIFLLGGVFALYEGVEKVLHPEAVESPVWAFAVLGVALVLEGFSLRTAVRESAHSRGDQSWPQFVRTAKAPELIVVVLEDSGALLGLVFALAGVTLAVTTGDGRWDGAGTLAIGALLVAVGVVLFVQTSQLLLGEAASPAQVRLIEDALVAEPGIDRVLHLRTSHLSPEEVLVAAKVAIGGSDRLADVAATIDSAEARVRAAMPLRCVIYLEPDVYRGPGGGPDTPAGPPPPLTPSGGPSPS